MGNYNAGNLGDDLLLSSIKLHIRKYLPEYNVEFVAPNKPTDYYLFPTGIMSFLKFKWIKTLYGFYKADVLVLGGGGLLNPEEYRSLFVWGTQIVMAKLFRLKVVCLANSFPFSDSKLYRYLLKKIDFFTVRDSASYNFLNKIELKVPIKLASDLAFAAKTELYNDAELEFDADDFIVLNLRSYKHIDLEVQIELYHEIVDYITANTNLSLYLLPFAKEDVGFLREMNNLTRDNGRVFLLPFEKEVIFTALQRSKLVISQRLHPNIVSLSLNKPTIALSYSSKVASLVSDFPEAKIFDLTSEFNLESFSNTFKELIESKVPSYELEEVLEQHKKRAEMNFTLLKSYLE